MTADQEVADTSRSPRFTQWCSLLVFSTVVLGAAVEASKHNGEGDEKTEQFERLSITCASLTFAVVIIVILMHFNGITSLFIVGTKIEGFICLVLAGLWAGTVAVVADSRHGLAVNNRGEVSNGNLYYFTWAGFICSVMLITSYLRSAFEIDLAGEIKTRSARLNLWSAHLAAALVVLGASSNIFKYDCEEAFVGQAFCRRTKLGIVIGSISFVFSLVIVGLKIKTSKAPFLLEAVTSFVLLVLYAFGVAYITSEQGPGSPLGNLYYFTWICFLSSFMLSSSCYEDYTSATSMADGANGDLEFNNEQQGPNNVITEDLDDTI